MNDPWAYLSVIIPSIFGFFMLIWIYWRRYKEAKRRRENNLCMECAFELAEVEGDNCPECGAYIVRE